MVMDIQLNVRRLLAPNNIQISYPKIQGNSVITWNMVRNPDESKEDKEILEVKYNVYRGISTNGIFYKQNLNPLDNNRYEDKTLGKNPNTVYWYKVSTVYLNKDNKWVEGPLSAPVIYRVNNTNKWFNKINERNLWILKNTGQLFDLYTRKMDGKKCPKCYDKVRGRASDHMCTICYGTGVEGGYEPMFQLYVRQKPATQSLDIGNAGFQLNHSPGAWTISTVELKNRDILINPQGKIFQVTSSHINQAAGYLFHQELQLKEYDVTDPIYRLKRKTLYPNL